MGHSRRRPITGQTVANVVAATYIIVEMTDRPTTIQCIANGTVTYTVDRTIQNIFYSTAVIAAKHLDTNRYVDPAAAAWASVATTGSVSTLNDVDTPVFAFRINQTAGTGSVTYTILQA